MARAKREGRESRKPKPAPSDTPRSLEGNQGEGNREADRRYREAATSFERSGRVPKAAEEARRSVEEEERRKPGRADDELADIDVDDYDEDALLDAEEARREARDRSRLS
jgi:hypothetical protein